MSSERVLRWLSVERLLPLVAILSGLILEVLSYTKYLPLTTGEQIILGILILLSVDTLVERTHSLARIENKIDNLVRVSPQLFFKQREDFPPLRERLEAADQIAISGLSLATMKTSHFGLVQRKLEEGCHIKLLVLNPENEGILNLASKSFIETQNVMDLKNEIKATLNQYEGLLREYSSTNALEIRVMDEFPPCSFILTDWDNLRGCIKAELYLSHITSTERPHFTLMKNQDRKWFEIFKNNFDSQWNNASPIAIEEAPT